MKVLLGFLIFLAAWGIAGFCLNAVLSASLTEHKGNLISFFIWWELLIAFLGNAGFLIMLLVGERLGGYCEKLEKAIEYQQSFVVSLVLFFGLYSTIRFFQQPDYVFLILIGCTFFYMISVSVAFYWLDFPFTNLKASAVGGTIMLHVTLWFGLYGGKILPVNEYDLRICLLIFGAGVFSFVIVPIFHFLFKRAWRLSLAEELGEAILLEHEDKNVSLNPKLKLRIGLNYLGSFPPKGVRQWIKESIKSPEKTWDIFEEMFSDRKRN